MSKTNSTRVNERIKKGTPEVRLIDHENNQVGVVKTEQALDMAFEVGLDLVEVASNSEPPVCRIMDHGKWLYEQKRKQKQSRKKQHVVSLKEIRLRPEIGDNDRDVKVNHARKFLEKGDKVQFTLRFRGREMAHTDQGKELMETIAEMIKDVAKVDRAPNMQGRRMIMIVSPT
ncbi:translation initiation factor IF-3 [Sedimentisphaera salicampi]|uniref:translation initiation factor IF-3 n=1 Tax=Sedimentisphaera salicampi TaxID=1941349 RepID=UPI000A271B1D|nr:translation initiation factor IF-3 [Sedimentisphaera salicampi]